MALQTYTWNNGTSENPVELNQSQLSLLLKLALDANVQSDVRGHITTSSGKIQKYTKWQLEQKYENLVIHAEEEADIFSIRPLRSAINEGESTEIIVTGMSSSSVKFRLAHSFRGVSGISQSAAEARIHMNGNILVVDNPQENAAWVDALTIQAIPIYEEWGDDVTPQTCTVTITAKEITGITLNAPSLVVYGEEFVSEVALAPSSNTKKNYVNLDATCLSDGTLPVRKPSSQGLNIYTTAPAEECELSLTVNAYLFGDTETASFSVTKSGIESKIPSIRFTVTTDGTFSDISSVNPKITLQKVDSEDTPIGEPVVLTGTVSGSSLVYNYGNGNVAGDGSEMYQVTFDAAPEGYRNIQQMTITPNQVITEIAVQYVVKRPGMYQVYADGYEPISAVQERGGFISGKTRIGIAIVTDETKFIIGVGDGLSKSGKLISSTTSCPAEGRTIAGSSLDASEDYDGEKNTIAIANYFTEHSDLIDGEGAIPPVREKTVTYGGQVFNGYIPALGQALLIVANATALDSFISTYYQRSSYLPTGANRLHSSTGSTELTKYWNPNSSSSNAEHQSANQKWVTCFEFNDTIIPLI